MDKYGQAAIVEMIVEKLPEVMREVSRPLEQIDKLTVIDNGGSQGASKVAKIVTDVTTNGFEVLKSLTGVDLNEALNNFVNKDSKKHINPNVVIEDTPQDETSYTDVNL